MDGEEVAKDVVSLPYTGNAVDAEFTEKDTGNDL